MSIAFPNESTAYRESREKLLQAEIDLRRQMEAVAAMRRALPKGGVVPEDYVFEEVASNGALKHTKLSELFGPPRSGEGKDSLIVYNMMFPRHPSDDRAAPGTGETAKLKHEDTPCPSCTGYLDQLNAAAMHLLQQSNFVVIAKAPAEQLTTFARERGWSHLRLLSAAHNTFKHDYAGENEKGEQMPMMNVFERDADGTIRHFWSSEMLYAPTDANQDPRHNGTTEPLWNLFDLTRPGRPQDWHEQVEYNCCH